MGQAAPVNASSLPAGLDSIPGSIPNLSQSRSVVDSSLRQAVSKNEFASWMRTLSHDDLQGAGADVKTGDALLDVLRAQYAQCKDDSRVRAVAKGLSTVECLAVLLYTHHGMLMRNVNSAIQIAERYDALQQYLGDPRSTHNQQQQQKEGRQRALLSFARVLDEAKRQAGLAKSAEHVAALRAKLAEEYSYLLTPLLSGLTRLPTHSGGMAFRLLIRRTPRKEAPIANGGGGSGGADGQRKKQSGWFRARRAINAQLEQELAEYILDLEPESTDSADATLQESPGAAAKSAVTNNTDANNTFGGGDEVGGTLRFDGFTSCASRFLTVRQQDLLAKALADPSCEGRVAVMCMRVTSARIVGPLSFFPKSNEVALLPGTRARSVPQTLLSTKWKAVLCDMWGLEAHVASQLDVFCFEEVHPAPFSPKTSLLKTSQAPAEQGKAHSQSNSARSRKSAVSDAATNQSSSHLKQKPPGGGGALLISCRSRRSSVSNERDTSSAANEPRDMFADELAKALVTEYVAILEDDPENVSALRHLAFLYKHTGRAVDEMKILRRIIRIVPSDWDANVRLAYMLGHVDKDYKASIAQYEAALSHHDGTPEVHCIVGQLMETHNIGDIKHKAKKHYELGIRLNPGHADSHAHLGYLLEKRGDAGDMELAVKHYEATLAIDPGHPKACHLLARELIRTCEDGDPAVLERCRKLLAVSVEREGTNADARYWHAMMLVQQFRYKMRHNQQLSQTEFPPYCPESVEGERERLRIEAQQQQEEEEEREKTMKMEAETVVKEDALQGGSSSTGPALLQTQQQQQQQAPPPTKTSEAFDAACEMRDEFDAVLELDPQYQAAYSMLGGVLVTSFRAYAEAEPILKTALRMNEEDSRALAFLGVIAEKQAAASILRDFDDARTFYESALKFAPGRLDTLCQLGMLLERHYGDRRSAKHLYRRALEVNPAYPLGLACAGWLAERSGKDLGRARQLYEQAVKLAPNHAYSVYRLGFYMGGVEQNADEARRLIEHAIALDPDDAKPYHTLALLLDKYFSEHDAALECYKKCLDRDPFDADCHNDLGFMLFSVFHDTDKSKWHFQQAISICSTHADAHNNLGMILQRFGNGSRLVLEDARAEYEAAVASSPNHSSAQGNLAALVADLNATDSMGRDESARRMLLEALRLNPKDLMSRVALGQLLENGYQDYRGAREHYTLALQLEPQYGPAHCYFGRMILKDPETAQYANLSGYKEGLQYLENAVALMPQDAESRNLLGVMLEDKLGRADEAKLQFEVAVRLNPKMAEAHFNLGKHLAKHSSLDDNKNSGSNGGGEGGPSSAMFANAMTPPPSRSSKSRRQQQQNDDREELLCIAVEQRSISRLALSSYLTKKLQSSLDDDKAMAEGQGDIDDDDGDIMHVVRCSAKSLARRHLLRAIRLDPQNPTYRLTFARLLMGRFNDLPGAVDHLDKVLDAFPQHCEALFMLGAIEEHSKRRYDRAYSLYCRAIEAAEEAVHRRTSRPPSTSASDANAAAGCSPPPSSEAADAAYVAHLSRLRIELHFALGQLMKKHLGNLRGAVAQFEAILRLDPDNTVVLASLERLRKSGLNPDCMDNDEYAAYLLSTFGDPATQGTSPLPEEVRSSGGAAGGSHQHHSKAQDKDLSSRGYSGGQGDYPQWY